MILFFFKRIRDMPCYAKSGTRCLLFLRYNNNNNNNRSLERGSSLVTSTWDSGPAGPGSYCCRLGGRIATMRTNRSGINKLPTYHGILRWAVRYPTAIGLWVSDSHEIWWNWLETTLTSSPWYTTVHYSKTSIYYNKYWHALKKKIYCNSFIMHNCNTWVLVCLGLFGLMRKNGE